MFNKAIYVVPFDFTPVSESALKLALDMAKANDGYVYLFHVVGNKSEKSKARANFQSSLSELSEEDRALSTYKVIVGDLYEDIGKIGDVLKANMIIMGTHGAKGMQKIFGSRAAKMIDNAVVPLLITQGKRDLEKIKNIVMPFSFSKDSIKIATYAGILAKKFNAKIHLVAYHDNDEWLEGQVRTNQIVVNKHFNQENVEHEIVNLKQEESYEKELLDYCHIVDADIIAAAYYKEGFLNPNTFIQHMMENEYQIPLLTVNTEELSIVTGNAVVY